MSDTGYAQPKATTADFEDEKFADLNRSLFDEYIARRVRGYHPNQAFRLVFGDEYDDQYMTQRIFAVERNPYYKRNFPAVLQAAKIADLWNQKVAIHELLSVARDVYAKDSTRLNAMKELNVLVGITVVDENGKTRAGSSLDDFYKANGLSNPPPPPVAGEGDGTKPPEPPALH